MKSYRGGPVLLLLLLVSVGSVVTTAFQPSIHTGVTTRQVRSDPFHAGSQSRSTFHILQARKDNAAIEGKFIPKKGDVVLDPAYSLGYGSIFIGFLLTLFFSDPMCNANDFGGFCPPTTWGFFIGSQFALFGAICALQAYRLRFIVTKDGYFTIKNVSSEPGSGTFKKSGKAELEDWGENYVVGGKNRWALKKFINYKFFPNEFFPVLVYFKEVQTSKDKWDMGIGVLDKRGNGQMHWFPAICNCLELRDEWQKRGVKKME